MLEAVTSMKAPSFAASGNCGISPGWVSRTLRPCPRPSRASSRCSSGVGGVVAAGEMVRGGAAKFRDAGDVRAERVGGTRRAGVLVGLEYEAAHAAGFGERHGVENVERPNHAAGAGRVRIKVHMDID